MLPLIARIGVLVVIASCRPQVQRVSTTKAATRPQPSVEAYFSAIALQSQSPMPTSQSAPISGVFLGTPYRGIANTDAKFSLSLVPNDQRAQIRVQVDATTRSHTSAHKSKTTVQSTTTTEMVGTKDIFFEPKLLRVSKSEVEATSRSCLNSVCSNAPLRIGRRLRTRIGTRKFYQSQSLAERQSSQIASQQLAKELDKQVAKEIQKGQGTLSYIAKMIQLPGAVILKSTQDQMTLALVSNSEVQAPPVPWLENSEMGIRVHEETLSALFRDNLGGKTFGSLQLRKSFSDMSIPLFQDMANEIPKDYGLRATFDEDEPILIRFDAQKIIATVTASWNAELKFSEAVSPTESAGLSLRDEMFPGQMPDEERFTYRIITTTDIEYTIIESNEGLVARRTSLISKNARRVDGSPAILDGAQRIKTRMFLSNVFPFQIGIPTELAFGQDPLVLRQYDSNSQWLTLAWQQKSQIKDDATIVAEEKPSTAETQDSTENTASVDNEQSSEPSMEEPSLPDGAERLDPAPENFCYYGYREQNGSGYCIFWNNKERVTRGYRIISQDGCRIDTALVHGGRYGENLRQYCAGWITPEHTAGDYKDNKDLYFKIDPAGS